MTKNKNTIIEDYVYSELTVQQICSKYGISSKTISKIIAEANVPSRAFVSHNTKSNSAIYEAFNKGVSAEELSSQYNFSTAKIKKIVSTERKKAIVAEYKNGVCVKRIAENSNVSIAYVYQILQSSNVPLKQPQKGTHSSTKANYNISAVIDDYIDKELSVSDICKKYRISSSTLRNIVAKNDIPLRQTSKIPINKQQAILLDYTEKSLSVAELSEKYLLSISTVQNIIDSNRVQNADPFNQMNCLLKEYSKSLRSIAFYERKYNIPRFAIEKAIKNSNANKKREKLIKKAIEKYHNGISAGQIADELGISRSKFYRLIQAMEVSYDEQN